MSLDENNLQIDDFKIGHVLNHRSVTHRSITQRVYIKNDYLAEKRETLEKWGQFLTDIVGAKPDTRSKIG